MIAVCVSVTVIFSAISFFIYRSSKKQQRSDRVFLIAAAAFLIISIGLEVSIFNINFYLSRSNSPIDLTPYLEEYKASEGGYTVPTDFTWEFPEINEKLTNLHIDLGINAPATAEVEIMLTDDANRYYFNAGERTVYKNVAKSEYINLHTAGTTQALALTFECDGGDLNIDGITANAQRPFEFSFIRVVLIWGLLCLFYIFKPSSVLYKRRLVDSEYLKSTLTTAFILLQCGLIIILGSINPTFMGIATENYNSYNWDGEGIDFVELGMMHHNQYDELAQAILQGRTYIDNNDVPQSLIEMENPYDTAARSVQASQTGDSYRWDVAYFDGHYYVYFGIVPLLLMYLPFRVITGSPFPSAVGIMLFALIFSVGVFRLLDLICRKKFKSISVGTFLLTSLTLINCCGAMFLVKRPDFYSVPIITSMAFVVWGIYLWLRGLEDSKSKALSFFLGSLFLALSVGCRPQSVLICFVALPLFLGCFFKDRHIFKKEGIKELVILGVPFVVVASGIMYYNYIRFGSPFDFGSSYNLTTNDVTNRGFVFARSFTGLFTYLFQTPQFTGVFPYIEPVSIETNYIGKTITENCFGGLITSLPMLWFIFALPKAKNILKEKKLLALTLTLILIGTALVIADTQAGGILQRYYSDFGYIFFLGAIPVIFALCEAKQMENNAKSLNTLVFISAFLSIFYSIALAFSVSDVTIDTQNPTLFGTILHLVQFWI